MSNNAKALAEVLQSLAHHHADTSEAHHTARSCRALASVLIQSLRHHSPSDIAAWINWRLRTSQRPDHRQVVSLDAAKLAQQMNDVRQVRSLSKRKKRTSSKLDSHRAELLELRRLGASWSDLRVWLRRYPRIKVDRSTVIRRVTRWQKDVKA